jgi:hypothetical protein
MSSKHLYSCGSHKPKAPLQLLLSRKLTLQFLQFLMISETSNHPEYFNFLVLNAQSAHRLFIRSRYFDNSANLRKRTSLGPWGQRPCLLGQLELPGSAPASVPTPPPAPDPAPPRSLNDNGRTAQGL